MITILLSGPQGSCKTQLAQDIYRLAQAQRLDVEIVSTDVDGVVRLCNLNGMLLRSEEKTS